MGQGHSNLTEAVRSAHLFKIDGYCTTSAMSTSHYIKSRWDVDGHEWEVRFYPRYDKSFDHWIAMKLLLLSEPQRSNLTANLSCQLDHPRRLLDRRSIIEKSVSRVFQSRNDCSSEVLLIKTRDVPSSGYLVDDSVTVLCTITVLKELPDVVVPASIPELDLPPTDLHQHLGELLKGQRGGDVVLELDAGESFLAHKTILAARSPVFMAEFFGQVDEGSSRCVKVEGVEAAVFKVLLHFIYTDMAPELDEESEAAVAMAQRLLPVADRYGLDRLKLICESKLSGAIGVETVVTTLALAEKHNCALLKAKCVEFIAKSPRTLDAVLASDDEFMLFVHPTIEGSLSQPASSRRLIHTSKLSGQMKSNVHNLNAVKTHSFYCYISPRYHLQEQGRANQKPRDYKELFTSWTVQNHIERAIGTYQLLAVFYTTSYAYTMEIWCGQITAMWRLIQTRLLICQMETTIIMVIYKHSITIEKLGIKSASTMEHGRTNLTEAMRSVQLLKIDGFCTAKSMPSIKSRWNVEGHEWEVRFCPAHYDYYSREEWVALSLCLLSEPQRNNLRATLSCRLVDPRRHLDPSAEKSSVSRSRRMVIWCVILVKTRDVPSSGYLVNDSLTVECTITVLKDMPDLVVPAPAASSTEAPLPLPPMDLQRHFSKLLQCQRGTDVTFALDSGERFVAHKAILAARSPVFMA
ncbi:LOW QUALITY PROTEIN: hypothetical protein U9M48_026642 [Paspalum notatum var. saurae]|uniref:BTB/POZ domain-containing protein n=1 Tax=Paspalum notatum var. saurae TaxID=547442 RepID=A0AAQ3TSY6_PASNO